MIFSIRDLSFELGSMLLEGWPAFAARAVCALLILLAAWLVRRWLTRKGFPALEARSWHFTGTPILLRSFAVPVQRMCTVVGIYLAASSLPWAIPGVRKLFLMAFQLVMTLLVCEGLYAASELADLVLASDPVCDRVGIAVMQGGKVRLMSGNEVGAMLLNYLLEMRKQKGTLSQNSVAVKSFVSTDLAQAIAARYGCTFKNLLTGFKYIGEVVTQLESQGRADDFVMGFEESYGYLAGTHARDKDAVVASMLICEMAAYYKLQGLSLGDVMDKIYADYGYYDNAVVSYTFEGEAGMEKMAGIMNHLRQNPPKSLGGSPVVEHSDYQSSLSTDLVSGKSAPIDLPKSNVLEYKAENGCKLIVRPSGTEPKIKTYVTAVAADKAVAQKMGQQLIDESAAWMA